MQWISWSVAALALAFLSACHQPNDPFGEYAAAKKGMAAQKKAQAEYERALAVSVNRRLACELREKARSMANMEAWRTTQGMLIDRLRNGAADPVADAERAAREGQWGLIRTYTMIGSWAPGLECKIRWRMNYDAPLTLAYQVYSDVPGSCETFEARGDCALYARLETYAPIYNAKLAAHPAYPYRDLCRPGEELSHLRGGRRQASDPASYGFKPLDPEGPPRTVHEAARRGDIAALKRRLWRRRTELAEPDPFGMTPLAWAVVYRQTATALWLLENRAHPTGHDCAPMDAPTAPLRLALRTGQDELARQLADRTRALSDEPLTWTDNLLEDAALGNAPHTLQRMLTERNEGVSESLRRRLIHHPELFSPQVRRVVERYEASLCWRTRLPPDTAVELVSIYEGAIEGPLDPSGRRPGRVTVTVTSGAVPKLLVLSAHDETRWEIVPAEGAQIAGVLVLGFQPQHVRGAPRDTPQVLNWAGRVCRGGKPVGGGSSSEHLRELRRSVREATGLDVTRVHSAYSAGQFTL